MLDILNRLIHWLAEPADLDAGLADPLSHPALEAMDERALADLPFAPEDYDTMGCGA